MAPLFADPLAVACYACVVSLLWMSFRNWPVHILSALLMGPAVAISLLSFTSLILLVNLFSLPNASARLSPTISWRTDFTGMSFTSDWIACSIYANPTWFPLVKREVTSQRCFTSDFAPGNPAFRLSADEQSVIVSCLQEDGALQGRTFRIR